MRTIIYLLTIICLGFIRNTWEEKIPSIISNYCNINGRVMRNVVLQQAIVDGETVSIISFEITKALASESIAVLYDIDGNILGYEEIQEDISKNQNNGLESVHYMISLGKHESEDVPVIEIIEDESHPSINGFDIANTRNT